MKSFEDEIIRELNKIKEPLISKNKFLIATGTLAYNFMKEISDRIGKKFEGIRLEIVPIVNRFFGETITVSGLITGQDLIRQVSEYKEFDKVIIPRTMMKADEEVFLDNLSLEEVSKKMNKEIIVSKVDGKDFIKSIMN